MTPEKYIVFDYLKFIWKRKWLIIILTIILGAIAYIYSANSQKEYETEALIFVGNAENDKHSKPDFIKSMYENNIEAHLKPKFSILLPGNFQIVFKLQGYDEEEVRTQLTKAANAYVEDLTKRYNSQYASKEQYSTALSDRVSHLEKVIAQYNGLITSQTLSEEQRINYSNLILEHEVSLAKYKEKLFESNLELSKMEKPELMQINSIEKGTSPYRNTALAMAFGFQFLLVVMVVWKYIQNARRASK